MVNESLEIGVNDDRLAVNHAYDINFCDSRFHRGAAGADEARALAAAGAVRFDPCHHHDTVGPMAGLVTPSMPVFVVEERGAGLTGCRTFGTLNEGLGKVLRFGANDASVVERLRWLAGEAGPILRDVPAANLAVPATIPAGNERIVRLLDEAQALLNDALAVGAAEPGVNADAYALLGQLGIARARYSQSVSAKLLDDAMLAKSDVLKVTLHVADVQPRKLDELKSLLKAAPGSAKVQLHVQSPGLGEVAIAAGSAWHVALSDDLIGKLERVFGHGAARMG